LRGSQYNKRVNPVLGGLTVVAVIVIYAIIIGVILILRGIQERIGGGEGSVAAV
jgi:hypothetical protein